MGAYYEASLEANKKHTEVYVGKLTEGEYFRVNTHDIDGNGLKLMEHSYIGNSYVAHILSLIEDNPTNVIWLCDYSEDETYNWETVNEVETNKMEIKSRFRGESGFIINHTTNEYISLKAYQTEFRKHSKEWATSPLPFLTNSEEGAMGGGDLRTDEPTRGLWKNHLISYSKSLGEFKSFKNITKDVIVWEDKRTFVDADEQIVESLKATTKEILDITKLNVWDREGEITIDKAYLVSLIQGVNNL